MKFCLRDTSHHKRALAQKSLSESPIFMPRVLASQSSGIASSLPRILTTELSTQGKAAQWQAVFIAAKEDFNLLHRHTGLFFVINQTLSDQMRRILIDDFCYELRERWETVRNDALNRHAPHVEHVSSKRLAGQRRIDCGRPTNCNEKHVCQWTMSKKP
jgi:hypothetical protein